MKKYFTSFDLEDGKYKGTIHDAVTNQAIYTTQLHESLAKAAAEVNESLSKLEPNKKPTTQNNSAPSQSSSSFKKITCCGA